VSELTATEDGHYVAIDGRRRRATDPSIPEDRRDELVHTLMGWLGAEKCVTPKEHRRSRPRVRVAHRRGGSRTPSKAGDGGRLG
jgi:hypothetical protein